MGSVILTVVEVAVFAGAVGAAVYFAVRGDAINAGFFAGLAVVAGTSVALNVGRLLR